MTRQAPGGVGGEASTGHSTKHPTKDFDEPFEEVEEGFDQGSTWPASART